LNKAIAQAGILRANPNDRVTVNDALMRVNKIVISGLLFQPAR
jgi:hypothetical protein